MDIDIFPATELPTVFRVLRSVLTRDAGWDEPAERFLRRYALITGFALSEHPPALIAPERVRLGDPLRALRLLQLASIAALLRVPLCCGAVDYLHALARALDVHDPVLGVLQSLVDGKPRLARLRVVARGMRSMMGEARAHGGLPSVLRYVGAMAFKMAGLRDRLPDYKRLGLLPEGTLGREFWKHMTACGFAFPGERGGIPPFIAYHDVAHVLAGHGTDGAGEIQQGCFQAGNRRHADGFVFAVFVLLHFHHGLRITPAGPPETGHFDPDKVLWAMHRGARCRVDMTHGWDFWPQFARGIDEARKRCGLLPPLHSLPSAA
jgi:hypothetical protein